MTAATAHPAIPTHLPRRATGAGFEDGASANDALLSALENAEALGNRSAGSFSSAFATAAATFGGTDFRSCVTGCASSVTIFMMICCAVDPTCGGLPVSISYSTQPSE